MKNVLIITEQKQIEESLRAMLADSFVVFSATSPDETLRVMREKPIDIAIVDTPLEEMDLSQFIQELKNNSPESIPIVLLSTSDERIKEELTENKVYEWAVKPFKRRELAHLILRAEERLSLLKRAKVLEKEKEKSATVVKEQHSTEKNLFPEEDSNRFFYYYQETLRKFSRILTYIFEPEKLFEMIATTLGEVFEVGKLAILLKDKSTSSYRIKSALRISKDTAKEFRIKEGFGVAGWLSKNGQILTKYNKNVTDPMKEEMELLESEVCIPLFSNGDLLGILSLGKKITGEEFNTSELRLLYMMSNYTALAIQNSYFYNEIVQHKKHLADIMRNIPSGVITIDNTGKITTINESAREILGIPARPEPDVLSGEAGGPARQDLAGGEDTIIGEDIQKAGSLIADILLRTLNNKRVYHRSEVVYPGENVPLGISTAPLKNEQNEVKGALMVFQNLSEVKKLEQEQDRSKEEDFWKELATRIAHEIRNPLVSISTFTQLLPEKMDEKDFVKDYYAMVLDSIQELNEVINRLEKFSQSSKINLSLGNINSVLKEVLQEFEKALKKGNIQTHLNLATSVPNSYIDSDQLMEAFSHLIKNSISAMPDGGLLEIGTSYDAHHREIKIILQDRGKGIGHEDMANIYSPFFTTGPKGFGLGLPIARKITEKHGGKIDISSTIHRGTTVTISIPFISAPDEIKEQFYSIEPFVSPAIESGPLLQEGLSLEEEVSNIEKKLIRQALNESGGVKAKAAKLLNISRRMLAYKMEKLDLRE